MILKHLYCLLIKHVDILIILYLNLLMIGSVKQKLFSIIVILLPFYTIEQTAKTFPKSLQILTSPLITDDGTVIQRSICFADCKSCQASTGSCQTCFEPWFQLNQGRCILSSPSYTLQSTEQQRRSVNFIPSAEWFKNRIPISQSQFQSCRPDLLVLNVSSINIIGPFINNDNLTYQRTLTRHNYFGIKFLLILSNWNQSPSTLTIKITNQGGTVIANQQIKSNNTNIKNAKKQKICSPQNADVRVSVSLQVIEQQSSQIFIQFNGNMQAGASWSLSSFVLITGPCNETCQQCQDFTPRIQGCTICRNFLASTSVNQRCNTCLNGFSFNSTAKTCQKCPIQFKQCQAINQSTFERNLSCQFPQLTVLERNCNFTNVSYFDRKDLTQRIFFGSYFVVQPRGAIVTRCGRYSVAGPANFGSLISGTFVELPPHIEMSIHVNIFIFDQQQPQRRYSIAILVDGNPVEFGPTERTITIVGTANQCNLRPDVRLVDAIKTFSPKTFFRHNKINNVVVAISLATADNTSASWGIRDVRFVFKRCDDNCQLCLETGCQRCRGLFQLEQNQCRKCVDRTGLSVNGQSCLPCPDKCLYCNFTRVRNPSNSSQTTQVPICTQCFNGYYLYTFKNKTTCEIHPNFGQPVTKRISQVPGCFFQPLGLNFDTNQNRALTTLNFPVQSTGKNIQFYLIKYGDWEGDTLDIYANDLLIKKRKFSNEGGNYCGSTNSNDYISYEQFELQDNNNTLTLQFQAVRRDINKNRKFGIANLTVFPVGCSECSRYNFNYKTKYNYDQRLFVQQAFNLVYRNDNPQQFKNIFKLMVGNRQLSYDITANDSIRYWLRSQDIGENQILQGNVTVKCLYPQRVYAEIPTNLTLSSYISRVNAYPFFQGNRRILQEANRFQGVKTLDNNAANVIVERFSPLRQQEPGVLGSQTFFSVITRMVIYLGFISFFIGCQTPCTHFMHSLQKLWVHIYVASLALSPVLKTALWGFRQSQDQNIAINPDQWQSGLPRYLYYDAPAQYQHYYKDITFFRHIYNVGVAFAILILVYVVFFLIFRNRLGAGMFTRHMKVTFVHRPLFYFNSIIFYQYFTVVIACCLQFLDLRTRTNQPVFAGVNAAACVIAFIFATLYPIILHIILHRKRKYSLELLETLAINNRNKQYDTLNTDIQNLEEEHVLYNNRYSQIFYRFLPKNLWHQVLSESDVIGEKHFFYNIFRFGDLWWHAIIVILLYHSPFAQAFLLVLTNGFHLAVNTFSKLDTNKYFRILKSLQLVFFIVIQIMIIVMHSLLKTLRYESYKTLGVVALIFVYFILTVVFLRFLYTLYRIITQYRHTSQTDQRSVIRKDQGFNTGWIRNILRNRF